MQSSFSRQKSQLQRKITDYLCLSVLLNYNVQSQIRLAIYPKLRFMFGPLCFPYLLKMSLAKPAVEKYLLKVNSKAKQLVNTFQLLRVNSPSCLPVDQEITHLPRIFCMLKMLCVIILVRIFKYVTNIEEDITRGKHISWPLC